MQALTAFAPLVAFFVTYSLRGRYAATAVLMVAMLALLAFDWLRTRRIPPLHALSTVLVLVFGGATLLLHNRLFIQWKPTILFWLVSAAFLASAWIGERTLAQRFLAPALEGRLQVGAAQLGDDGSAHREVSAALSCSGSATARLCSHSTCSRMKPKVSRASPKSLKYTQARSLAP